MQTRQGVDRSALVRAAAAGDQGAWTALVDAYVGLVWAIARNHRLSPMDAADVSQTTWLRLFENIDRIQEPSRVGAWLATTTRRECLRLIGRAGRQVLVEDTSALVDAWAAVAPDVDTGLLAHEQDNPWCLRTAAGPNGEYPVVKVEDGKVVTLYPDFTAFFADYVIAWAQDHGNELRKNRPGS